jgi:hypothetical protein
MKKGLLVIGFIILSMSSAQANECPAGARCGIEINATTKVVTWHVLPNEPVVITAEVKPEIVKPTHVLSVQTSNQSLGVTGTPEQIQTSVNQMVTRVTTPIEIDPCINGGCNKVEVNATTQEVTVSTLSAKEIKQRSEDQITNLAKNAELVKVASKALPNVQTIEEGTETQLPTPLDESDPEWWNLWLLEWARFTFWFYTYNWDF